MIPYWVEGSEKVWMKGDFAPLGTNVYLLRKETGFAPSGTDVFDLFDDFIALDSSVWSLDGEPVVADSVLTLNNASTYENILSYKEFDVNNICEARAYYNGLVNAEIGFVKVANKAVWSPTNSAIYTYDYLFTRDGTTTNTVNDGVSRFGTDFHIWGVVYKSTQCLFYADYSLRQTVETNLPTGDLYVVLHNQYLAGGTGDFCVDWIRVRKYASVEPTITVIDLGDYYKVIVKNNVDQILKDYQFCILASDIDGVAESINIVSVMQQPINTRFDLFDGCAFYLNFHNGITDVQGLVIFTMSECMSVADRADRPDRAYGFHGNSYIEISTLDAIDTSGDFSIFVILRNHVKNGVQQMIINNRDDSSYVGYQLGISATSKLFFGIDIGTDYVSCTSDSVHPEGTLYIGAQRNGTNQEMFLNGTIAKSVATLSGDLSTIYSTYCGVGYAVGGWFLTADIDVIIAWNRALSASEHRELYDLFKQKDIFPLGVPDTGQQGGI